MLLKFFARVKNNKLLKAPRVRTIENRAKMLKADWLKNDITNVLIKMDTIFLILLPFGTQLYFI